jgi:hypothetical protein
MRAPLTNEQHVTAAARITRASGELRGLLELLADRPEVKARVLDKLLRGLDVLEQVRYELGEVSIGAYLAHFPNSTPEERASGS